MDIFGNSSSKIKTSYFGPNEDYLHPLKPGTEEVVENAPDKRPVLTFYLLLGLTAIVLVTQLVRIQLLNFPYYQKMSSGNSVKLVLIPASRGLIFSDELTPLARNTSENAVIVKLSHLPAKENDRQKLYQKVKNFLNLDEELIKKIEEQRKKWPTDLVIKSDLSRDEVLLLKENLAGLEAFAIVEQPIRYYDPLPSLSHLLGYMGLINEEEAKTGKFLPDESVGRLGLEKIYQDSLRGIVGQKYVEVDAKGQVVRTLASRGNVNPEPGYNLKLHLRLDLQKEVVKYLQEAIDSRNKNFGENKKLGASAIVLNPKNGAILSIVSLPSYDNNLFAKGISKENYQNIQNDETLPMLNRATQAQLPSGSVIKPVIAASALDAGTVSPNFSIDTPSAIQIGEFTFPDWKDHGKTDIRRAIAESNNIFFYGLGGGWENKMKGLGIDKMVNYFQRFSFGSPTGIDLTSENSGFVPSSEWKQKERGERWYIGDTYHFSIGQGDFLTTPLQLANAIAAIANGGTLYEPQLGASLLDANNQEVKKLEPQIKNKEFISPSALQVVREGMRQAVEYGSARRLNSLKIHIAGKTGTAQFGNQDRTHAWFVSFAPYEDPEIVVLVVVEGGGGGHESALPVAEKIYRYYYNDPAPEPLPEPTPTPTNPDTTVPIEGE